MVTSIPLLNQTPRLADYQNLLDVNLTIITYLNLHLPIGLHCSTMSAGKRDNDLIALCRKQRNFLCQRRAERRRAGGSGDALKLGAPNHETICEYFLNVEVEGS